MAKCGLQKYSFCTHKHDAPMCANCLLVQRRTNLYKWINGHKYKKCPHCGEYKALSEFKENSNGNKSWCHDCHLEYARQRAQHLKAEQKPIVKITEIEYGDAIATTKTYTAKEFKEWCKKLLNDDESRKRYIIAKL